MPPSARCATKRARPTSPAGAVSPAMTAKPSTPIAAATAATSHSTAMSNTTCIRNCPRSAPTPATTASSSRATCPSASAARASTHGSTRTCSTWTRRPGLRPTHSRPSARTGDSRLTTGNVWHATATPGGGHAWPRWPNTSTPSASTTSSGSSASGRFPRMPYTGCWAISTPPCPIPQMNCAAWASTRRADATPPRRPTSTRSGNCSATWPAKFAPPA